MIQKPNVNEPRELVIVILGLRGDKNSLTILRRGKSEFFKGKSADKMFGVLQKLSQNGSIQIEGYDAWNWEDSAKENPQRKCFARS